MLPIADWGSETTPFRFEGKAPIERSDQDPTMVDDAAGHFGFHVWLRVVDAVIARHVLIGVFDLPDRCWRDAYDDEVLPVEAAQDALHDEGFPKYEGVHDESCRCLSSVLAACPLGLCVGPRHMSALPL